MDRPDSHPDRTPPAQAHLSDEGPIGQSAADPVAVFGCLFDLHAAELGRYLARRVGVRSAEDLVAEVFVIAIARRRSLDDSQGTARAWLFGIATHLIHRHLRSQEREGRAFLRHRGRSAREGPFDDEDRIVDRVDAAQRAGALGRALRRLAPADRDVLLLTAWADLSPTEIADALAIPAGTVRSRLHRARHQLRGELTSAADPTQSTIQESR